MRIFLLIAVAFLLFIFPGCPGDGENTIPSKESPDISVGGWVAEVEPTEEEEKQQAIESALEEHDASYCFQLPANERDECILPLSNDSLSNCLKLIKYENKRQCLFHHAYSQEDISICDLMNSEDRQECLEHLSPPCTFVLDSTEKGRCLAFEYGNYSYCKDEDCYLDYAFEFQEEGACMMLPSGKKEGCLSAINHQDQCGDLDLSHKHLCYYVYALGDDSPRNCYYIDGNFDSEIAYQCFTHFAVEKDNPSLCEPILVTKRWSCYTEYALETGNKDGCYAIDTLASASREDCFKEYAYAYDDLSSCNEIGTEYVRQICYSALIFSAETLTMSECNSVLLHEWKDKCYQELAYLEGSEKYCNYIDGEATKTNCLLMFE